MQHWFTNLLAGFPLVWCPCYEDLHEVPSERLDVSSRRFDASPPGAGIGREEAWLCQRGLRGSRRAFISSLPVCVLARQTVDLKWGFVKGKMNWRRTVICFVAPSLSGKCFSRSGLLCRRPTALLPLHVSRLINRPHVTLLLEHSPMHYAGNTLPADGLGDTEPMFGVNVIFVVTRKSGSYDRGCSSKENNGVWPCAVLHPTCKVQKDCVSVRAWVCVNIRSSCSPFL